MMWRGKYNYRLNWTVEPTFARLSSEVKFYLAWSRNPLEAWWRLAIPGKWINMAVLAKETSVKKEWNSVLWTMFTSSGGSHRLLRRTAPGNQWHNEAWTHDHRNTCKVVNHSCCDSGIFLNNSLVSEVKSVEVNCDKVARLGKKFPFAGEVATPVNWKRKRFRN